MQISRRIMRPDHDNGDVVVIEGTAWDSSRIAERGKAIQLEERFKTMGIKLSTNTIGRSALKVTPQGMTWDDVFTLIESAPRTYADASVSDFVGEDGSTPSVSQIFANLQREAVRRGVITATARVPKTDKNGKPIPKMVDGKPKMTKAGQPVFVNRTDVFRFGFSKRAADAVRLPKWYTNIARKHGIVAETPPVPASDLDVVTAATEEE